GCLLLGAVTAVTLFPISKPGLDTSISWVPAPRVLIAYGVFFTFGWLVFVRRELVSTIGHRPWLYFAAAFVMSVAYMMSVVAHAATPALAGFVRSIAIAGVATWLWIYAVMGLFVRYFAHPRPLQRYLSDASYWM